VRRQHVRDGDIELVVLHERVLVLEQLVVE
jgi:hypothetical protein